jgi:pSer/pThr/pTyr-binding forkhead associated (FHA) protein
MIASTKTDIAAGAWSSDDRVMRLRAWGTETIHVLPQPLEIGLTNVSIGSAETCSIRLSDPTERVSRLHASLVQHGSTRWLLHDLGSKNGTRLNGARCRQIELAAGDEIGIGGLTLIAESRRSVALRGFLGRVLGWRDERIPVVDQALRWIRMAEARRTVLVLRGDGDLVPVARAIHRRAFGVDRPFIVCDPRRRLSRATVRSPENYETGMPAFAAATGGSLCVRSLRLPKDFRAVVAALRAQSSQVRLVICAQTAEKCDEHLTVPIAIPPLSTRPNEIDQIITEYAEDAITELGTPRTGFLPADRAWVRMHSASFLPDIEKATLRLVAIRESRNLSAAAARLGMAPVSLSRWIGRCKLPMRVDP